ncbi:MAG TPA: glyceraldehyde-3-phosphate dehydrogenase [Microbacteriaceae bacterium]|nr:glyceraldehyde-3-phosphate dehydrogenase [Microbacteriaceae bacterium]
MQQDHADWDHKIALAEEAIPLIGRLTRDRGVIPHVYGRKMANRSATQLMRALRAGQQLQGVTVDPTQALRVLQLVEELGLEGLSIDLGDLLDGLAGQEVTDDELRDVLRALPSWGRREPTDVVLYGFGRIGRLVARILIGHVGRSSGLRLRAIVVRQSIPNDLEKRASLLRLDSVHGAFDGTIDVDTDANTITANGTVIQVISSSDPADVDYTAYGITDAIVIDNTGRWRDAEGLGQHLKSKGVARVLLTAPGKGALPNVVYGINTAAITPDAPIITAASCTTNAITPVLKVLDDAYGIRHGHVETVHAYTNDQNLIDNLHKGDRRGRAAALNMVITETGAATAVAKALPELAGKLTGNAIRVPTPNVSMAILNLQLDQAVDRERVNDLLRETSLHGDLRAQVGFVESPEVVSTDFVGNNRAGIVDGLATIANDHSLVLYVWYDNEYGYSTQVVRVAEAMAEQVRAAAD